MERKTEAAYSAVLDEIAIDVPGFSPPSVMADYETALRNAVSVRWRETRLLGCWFHFARAVFFKSRH